MMIFIGIVAIGIILFIIMIIVDNNNNKKELQFKEREFQFKECEVHKFFYKPLNNYYDFSKFIFEKERLSKPLIKGICDSDEEYKIKVNNRKNDYIYNMIKRYDIPINKLYNLSYDQENELLVFTGLPFQNKTYSIHNDKLNTGGNLISIDSNITVNLLVNHFGNLPNFSFPIERKICKNILNINGISASLILEINNVYCKHADNFSTAYSDALIGLRKYDTFEIKCNLKEIIINCKDNNEYQTYILNNLKEIIINCKDNNEYQTYILKPESDGTET